MLYICVYYPDTVFRGISYEAGGHLMMGIVKVFNKVLCEIYVFRFLSGLAEEFT